MFATPSRRALKTCMSAFFCSLSRRKPLFFPRQVVRRLLQGGGDRHGVAVPHGGVQAGHQPVVRHILRWRLPDSRGRRGAQDLAQVSAPRASHPLRRRGQFLGDGGRRSVRAVHRDTLRSDRRAGRRRAGQRRSARRHRNLEQRVHSVQSGGRREPEAAPGPARRYWHGLRKVDVHTSGEGFQLRHGHFHAPVRRHPEAHGSPRLQRKGGSRGRGIPGHGVPRCGRSHSDVVLRHRRRRHPVERREGLRPPPRPASRRPVREAEPGGRIGILLHARPHFGRSHGRNVPRVKEAPGARDRRDQGRGGVLQQDAR
mmetsp:Transcript_19003/g.55163  ORF Transcript_19003/g.55163 Transcript_19003/m.55163 type:complete len:313 (+) Transcript_19003:538-1476(+)